MDYLLQMEIRKEFIFSSLFLLAYCVTVQRILLIRFVLKLISCVCGRAPNRRKNSSSEPKYLFHAAPRNHAENGTEIIPIHLLMNSSTLPTTQIGIYNTDYSGVVPQLRQFSRPTNHNTYSAESIKITQHTSYTQIRRCFLFFSPLCFYLDPVDQPARLVRQTVPVLCSDRCGMSGSNSSSNGGGGGSSSVSQSALLLLLLLLLLF